MIINNNSGRIHPKVIEISGDLGNFKEIDVNSWINLDTGEIVYREILDTFFDLEIPREKYFLLLMRDPMYTSWDQGEEVSKEHLFEIALGDCKEDTKNKYRNCDMFFNDGKGWIHFESKIHLSSHDVLISGLNCIEYRELTKEEYLKIKDLLIKKIDVNKMGPEVNIKLRNI